MPRHRNLTLTEIIISQCGELSPGAGSRDVSNMVALEGILANPKLLTTLLANKPVLFWIHWFKAASVSWLDLKMPSKLWSPWTVKMLGRRVWSLKFSPTLVLLITGVIFSALRSALFPIPDSRSIWGVPTAPADRITSFRAVAVIVADPKDDFCQQSVFD